MSGRSMIELEQSWPSTPLPLPPSAPLASQSSTSLVASHTLSIPEVAANVFVFLDLLSLTSAQQVCRMWRDEIVKPAKLKQKLFLKPAPVKEILQWTVQYQSPQPTPPKEILQWTEQYQLPQFGRRDSPPDLRYRNHCFPKLSANNLIAAVERMGHFTYKTTSVVGILHPALEAHPVVDKDFTRVRISAKTIMRGHRSGKPWTYTHLTQPPCTWKDVYMFEMRRDNKGYFFPSTWHLPQEGDTLATMESLYKLRGAHLKNQGCGSHLYFIIDRFVEERHALSLTSVASPEHGQDGK